MVRRLQGGHGDGVGYGEVNDGTGSKKNFGGKCWQPDGVSESLHRLWFAKDAHRFIYREPHQQCATLTSASPLLLRITVPMDDCHHEPVATLISLYIAAF
jgi:hypothetical protein